MATINADSAPQSTPHVIKHFDKPVIITVVKHFTDHHVSRLIQIKSAMAAGARLSEHEIQFLEDVHTDTQIARTAISNNPEYQTLFAKVIQLYSEIAELAIQNESSPP
ncbi:MAG: hypothetical protein MI864_27245 [Pseudomonadales bacterium]|uniref:Uncharacterized protein n=1 Tax=Oleiphilus messinensis TaxID=141451 RepID=A0A1Y0IEK7_9GAMM|nr:hypothetical protein [Oleiphilus messinensis]ARU58236.1 hypothetical protein OLMES_4220 [Oleiphilus messinensis]MCG8614224.1 hypothetical protein [Pseudomonadales bacterium]